jgi:hypothetical protein
MAFSSGQLVLDKPYFIGVQNAILFGCGYAGLCLGASAVNVEFAHADPSATSLGVILNSPVIYRSVWSW